MRPGGREHSCRPGKNPAGCRPRRRECYRVRDLNFTHEDLKFYLTDGFVIFSKPAAGHRTFMVFSADVEGGDAELILLPPMRSERQSLANFTGSPNLNEHFRSALFVFSQGVPQDILARVGESGKRSAERGLLLAGQYGPVVKNIGESFQLRLVEDLLIPASENRCCLPPSAGDGWGISISSRIRADASRSWWDNSGPRQTAWPTTSGRALSPLGAEGSTKKEEPSFDVSDYRIDAALDEQLHLAATTRVKITTIKAGRAFALQVSDRMTVSEVRLDGRRWNYSKPTHCAQPP